MTTLPPVQSWTQNSSTFPAKDTPPKPAYSHDGLQALTSFSTLPGDMKCKRISDKTWYENNVEDIYLSGVYDEMLGHVYAHKQAFNSDNSKILFGGGWNKHPIINADGTYYRTVKQGWRDLVWSNTSPWHLYGRSTDNSDYSKLLKIDIRDDSIETVIDLPYEISIGKGEGDISNDDAKIALTSDNGGNLRIDCVDIPNGTSHQINISRSFSECDWVMVSPLGNYVAVAFNTGVREINLYTWAGAFVRRITFQQHADLGLFNGQEVIVVVGHTEGTEGTSLDMYTLLNNTKTVLFGGGAAPGEFPNTSGQPVLDGHVSCSASRWGVPIAFVSAYSSTGGPHVVFGVAMDGSRDVYYYGFHNSSVAEYRDQPHFNTDRTGKIGIFKSTWGNSSANTECYLCFNNEAIDPNPFEFTYDLATVEQTVNVGASVASVGVRDNDGGSLHWNPGVVYSTAKDGDEQNAYTTMLSDINSAKNDKDDNDNYIYKTFMVGLLWKWLEPGNKNYSSGGGWAFIDDCLAALNDGQSLAISIINRRFNASDITKTPIPSDLRVAPYSYFHGSGSEPLATANMSRPDVIDRMVLLNNHLASLYNDDPRVVFITLGETSIHLPSGNVTDRDGNDVDPKRSYYRELQELFTQSKVALSNILILAELNFISTFDSRSEMDLFRGLIDNMIGVKGGAMSLPDSLACRHPAEYVARCCDVAGGYRIPAYDLITEYQGQIVIAPQAQTWSMDHERFPEDFDMMTNGAGQYSWHSHYPIFWPGSYTSRCSKYTTNPNTGESEHNGQPVDYSAIVRAEVINNPDCINLQKPSSAGSSGTDPKYLTVLSSGDLLILKKNPGITVNDIDMFTFTFADDPDVDVEFTVYFNNTGVFLGTETTEDFQRFNFDENTVLQGSGSPIWVSSTTLTETKPAPFGGSYLQSVGSNLLGTPAGEQIPIDLINLPAGVPHKMWTQYWADGVSDDSVLISVNDVHVPSAGYLPEKGGWEWSDILGQTLTSADIEAQISVREQDAKIAQVILVPASVTEPPIGEQGYITRVVGEDITLEPGEGLTGVVGQHITAEFISTTYDEAPELNMNYRFLDSDFNEVVSITRGESGVNVDSPNSERWFVGLTPTEVGNYWVEATLIITSDSDNTRIAFVPAIVTDGNENWPDDVSQNLGQAITLAVGQQLVVPAKTTNPHGFEFTRAWSIDTANASIVSSNPNAAIISADAVGTATLTSLLSSEGSTTSVGQDLIITIIPAPSPSDPPELILLTQNQAIGLGQAIEFSAAVDAGETRDVQLRWRYIDGPVESIALSTPHSGDTDASGFTELGVYNFEASVLAGGEVDSAILTITVSVVGTHRGGVTIAVLSLIE